MLIAAAQRFDDAILCLGSVTRRLQGEKMDPLEMAGIPGDILRLREGYASLDTTLRLAFFFISDQWPSIENNRIRLGELHDFAGSFSRFCGAVTSFDDAVIANESLAFQLMGPYEASREYAALASLYAGLFRPIFDAAQSILPVPKPHLSPLQGLCEDLRDYFTGKTDKDLEDALLKGINGGPKGIWNGTLTQATYFGRHFKVSARIMNMLFFFTDTNGKPAKAHFTKYPADKISEQDPLAIILSNYPRKG
jgi:hypothetical protein